MRAPGRSTVAPAAATTGAPIDVQISSAQKAAPEDVESQAPKKAHDDTVNQVDHHSAGRTIGKNEADEHSIYASRLGLSVADAMNPATVAAAFQSHISALEWESPDQLRKWHTMTKWYLRVTYICTAYMYLSHVPYNRGALAD